MQYIEINKPELPESFEIDLADETFRLSFAYNGTGDFFTVNLYKSLETGGDIELVMGEKLTLNKPLWSDFSGDDFPAPTIVPKDLSNTETRITYENMGEKVFLYIDDDGEDI